MVDKKVSSFTYDCSASFRVRCLLILILKICAGSGLHYICKLEDACSCIFQQTHSSLLSITDATFDLILSLFAFKVRKSVLATEPTMTTYDIVEIATKQTA